MPVRARCMMPNYVFSSADSSSGSKNSAGGESFVAGITAESLVKISLWWVVPYCTVEIPTEMEFTGTFQKYLQCANRT